MVKKPSFIHSLRRGGVLVNCTCRLRPQLAEVLGTGERGERSVGDLAILLAGAGADPDAADDMTIDDDRQPAWQVDALAFGGDGELQIDAGFDIAGRFAV